MKSGSTVSGATTTSTAHTSTSTAAGANTTNAPDVGVSGGGGLTSQDNLMSSTGAAAWVKSHIPLVAGVAAAAFVLIVIIIVVICCAVSRRRNRNGHQPIEVITGPPVIHAGRDVSSSGMGAASEMKNSEMNIEWLDEIDDEDIEEIQLP